MKQLRITALNKEWYLQFYGYMYILLYQFDRLTGKFLENLQIFAIKKVNGGRQVKGVAVSSGM